MRSIVGDDVASHIFGHHATVEPDNVSAAGSASNPPDFDDARSTISAFSTKSSSIGSIRSVDMYTGNNNIDFHFL